MASALYISLRWSTPANKTLRHIRKHKSSHVIPDIPSVCIPKSKNYQIYAEIQQVSKTSFPVKFTTAITDANTQLNYRPEPIGSQVTVYKFKKLCDSCYNPQRHQINPYWRY